MNGFVGREREVGEIRACCRSSRSELAAVYGRSRVGTTETILQALQSIDSAIYVQVPTATPANQLDALVQAAEQVVPGIDEIRREWEPLLKTLGRQDVTIVIDDFQRLLGQHDSLLERLHQLWESALAATGMTLILAGTASDRMRHVVTDGDSPLGRSARVRIHLTPLRVAEALQFLPDYSPEATVNLLAIYGGNPYALQTFDPTQTIKRNVMDTILSERGTLHSEPEFVLQRRLRQPNTYFSILQAIAHGHHTAGAIAEAAGLQSGGLSSYLRTLRDIGVVSRKTPVTAPESSRYRYRIARPLFRFWFRFVHGNRLDLRRLGEAAFDREIFPNRLEYTAPFFEHCCHTALPTLNARSYEAVGRWWSGDERLGVVGVSEDVLTIGDCIFSLHEADADAFRELDRIAPQVQHPETSSDTQVQYVLFSHAGYTDALQQTASQRDALSLYTTKDVLEALRSGTHS